MHAIDQSPRSGGFPRVAHIGIHEHGGLGDTLLLEEITHRINNDLTSTIAIIEMTAAHSASEDVRLALAGIAQHVYDVARVQHALRMPSSDGPVDAAACLRTFCQAISTAKLQYRNIELLLRENPLRLCARRCWLLTMIVSELIANSARHAFDGPGGRIVIELVDFDGTVRCSVSDNGNASADLRPGHGSKIVKALAGDLNGRVDCVFGADGTIVTVVFPADIVVV